MCIRSSSVARAFVVVWIVGTPARADYVNATQILRASYELPVGALGAATAVAASPDGANLYVTGGDANHLIVLTRVPATGQLLLHQTLEDGVASADALEDVGAALVSRDGAWVYTAAGEGKLGIYSRDVTGFLALVATRVEGVAGVTGLSDARDLAASPDGRFLYVIGSNSIAAFDTTTPGSPAFLQSLTDGVGGVDGLANPQAIAVAPDGKHVYVGSRGDQKIAVFSRNLTTGALAFVDSIDEGGGVTGLGVVADILFPPDGRFAYVTAGENVLVFSRDAATGSLSYLQSADASLVYGSAAGIALSANERQLFVHSWDAGQNAIGVVAAYDRDPSTGLLTFRNFVFVSPFEAAVTSGGSLVRVRDDLYVVGFDTVEADSIGPFEPVGFVQDNLAGTTATQGAQGVEVSSDGRNVYVAGSGDSALQVFDRDPATGALHPIDEERDGVGGVDALSGAADIALSPDGRSLYATAGSDDAVSVFARSAATGELTLVEAERNGQNGVTTLDSPSAVAVSPDGQSVYVTASGSNAITTFSRDVVTGALSLVAGTQAVDGSLDGVSDVAVSPDGKSVYTASFNNGVVALFARSQLNGSLAPLGGVKDGVGGVDGIGGAYGVAVSPDGRHVYAVGLSDQALAAFERDPAFGTLSFVSMYQNPTAPAAHHVLDRPEKVEISRDGRWVLVQSGKTTNYAGGFVIYRRDVDGGLLRYVQSEENLDPNLSLVGGTFAPDRRNLYVTDLHYGRVYVYSPEPESTLIGVVSIGALAWIRLRSYTCRSRDRTTPRDRSRRSTPSSGGPRAR